MFDFITIGGATRDMVFLTDKGKIIETPENLTEQRLLAFEYGAKIRSEELFMNFGGGACNAGVTFSKIGFDVAVVCRIGDDETGKSIVENLHNYNVDTSLVQTDKNKNSAISFIVVNNKTEDHDKIIFSHRGASDNLTLDRGEIKQSKWLYLTALYHGWGENLEKIYSVVQDSKVKLAWNPGIEEIRSGKKQILDLMKHTDIFIVNKDEAIELAQKDRENKMTNDELNDVNKLLTLLRSWGASIVAITDGENGASVCEGDNIFHASAFARQKVETTGAGDAFGSAFVCGYVLTKDLEESLKFGILNSGSVIGYLGAQKGVMTREEIEADLDKVEVSKIK